MDADKKVYPEDHKVGVRIDSGEVREYSALVRDDQYLLVGSTQPAPNGGKGWFSFWVRLGEIEWADKHSAAKFNLEVTRGT